LSRLDWLVQWEACDWSLCKVWLEDLKAVIGANYNAVCVCNPHAIPCCLLVLQHKTQIKGFLPNGLSFICYLFIFMVLVVEPRALHMLGKHSIIWTMHPALNGLFLPTWIFIMGRAGWASNTKKTQRQQQGQEVMSLLDSLAAAVVARRWLESIRLQRW
jgi:hypothetical protein